MASRAWVTSSHELRPGPLYPVPLPWTARRSGQRLSLLARLCLLRFAPGWRERIGRCPAADRTHVDSASGTPLSRRDVRLREGPAHLNDWQARQSICDQRSEERRVGKECRSRGSRGPEKKRKKIK